MTVVLPAEVRSHGPQTIELRVLNGKYSSIANNLDDALDNLESRVGRDIPGVVLQPLMIRLPRPD